ncbi:MAG TPA: CHAT domain-containing protein [Candidatus Eisenbacteria bacterium]|nr:CHAT domain-containing protein [Candidatus Eisenbacteria bacterium]
MSMAVGATLTIEPLAGGALRLRLDVPERDLGEPLQQEFRQPIDDATLRALQASAPTLLRAGERPAFGADARACGAMLYRTLVPEALRPELRALTGPLVIATSLVGVPWEILHDDEEFWGLRYTIGRRLLLERPIATRAPAVRRERPRALVVGVDPRGDLPFVRAEVEAVCDALERLADVDCVSDRLATFERVVGYLGEGFDIVHFCGHVVTDERGESALLLAGEERLPARVVEANLAGRPLVFVNGCASAAAAPAQPWDATVSSVAHAFLVGGATAVVGTVAEVSDARAATLAATFYERALGGASLGTALREARARVREVAPASPAWLSFVLYGNPARTLGRDERGKVIPLRADVAAPPVVTPVTVTPLPAPSRVRGRWGTWALVAVAVLLALGLVVRFGRSLLPAAGGPIAVGVMDVSARGAGVPDWMRTLTRDSLNTVLSRVPNVQVYSRQKIDFLREKRHLTEIEAAEALGIRKMVAARVGVAGDEVTLDVEVVDIASGLLESIERVEGPESKLLDLQTELALRTLTALGVHPSADELRRIVEQRRDATVEAYRLLTETLGGSGGSAAPKPTAPPSTLPPNGAGSSWLELTPPAYAQVPDQDEVAIRELLRRYAAALEAKQVDALAQLQTDMSDAQRASLARYFAVAQDLHVQVRDVDVLVEGDDAVVTFTREDTFTDAPSGRPMRLEVRITGRLLKQAGGWKIKSLGSPS